MTALPGPAPDGPLRTSNGVELAPEVLEQLAAEAEAGYDPATLQTRSRTPEEQVEHLADAVLRLVAESHELRQALRALIREGVEWAEWADGNRDPHHVHERERALMQALATVLCNPRVMAVVGEDGAGGVESRGAT